MRRIHRSNSCIAYIYFDYKSEEKQTGDYIVRTLLKQLLSPLDLVPPELGEVYDSCCSEFKDPEKVVLSSQLLSATAKFSNVFIMLDALDECSNQTLKEVIDLIRRFKDSGIKVFCTFRPFINIEDRLGVPIHLIDAHDDDVRNYLSIRLNNEWCYDKCFLERIINRLTEDAKGKSVSSFCYFLTSLDFCLLNFSWIMF